MIRPFLIAALAATATLTLSACATIPPPHPEARPFAAAPAPTSAVDAAFARATAANKRVILIFGYDKCHDSRALAGWFGTPRFQAMLGPLYEIVWVDVGDTMGQNGETAKRFQVAPIAGTPTVVIADKDGTPLNLTDARDWRNAASRSEDDIYRYFEKWGHQ